MNKSGSPVRPTFTYLLRTSLLGLPLLCSGALPAQAQTVAPAASGDATTEESSVVTLNTFVVSGTVAPRRQLESAAAITTIDADMMKVAAPKAGPDLMKLVPGIYVETAGGEGRANVYSRGIPQAGGYTFVGLQEDGMPAIAETATRGVAPDMLTRLTGLVGRVESVRGGTSGVFMNNAPAGIVNFINREGTQVRQGEVSFSTSDYAQLKGSIWASGPVNESTTYAVALDYRVDDGQRDLGFSANKGGGIVANLKHFFANDRGSIKVTGKFLDERNAFYVPIPMRNASDPQGIPGGPDILKGVNISPDLRQGGILLDTPDGRLDPDLADGGRPVSWYIGADLDLQLRDGLKLRNIIRYTDVDWTSSITVLSSVATPLQTLANAIGTGAGTTFAAARSGTNYAYRIVYPGNDEVVTTPSALNGNGLGIQQSLNYGRASIQSFQDDLRLQLTTDNRGGAAVGLYLAQTKARSRTWGHTMITEVADLPRRIDFEYLDAITGDSLGFGTYNGMRSASNAGSYTNNSTSIDNLAPYLNVEQAWGKWNFDAGVRHERKTEEVINPVTRTYNINPAGLNNPALRAATFASGNTYTLKYDMDATIWTAAANYTFNDRFSAYGRFMNGYRMPNTQDILTQARARNPDPGPTNRIKQAEAGVKYATRRLSIFASVIASELANQSFAGVIAQPDGSLVNQTFFRDTEGYGVELEAFYTPVAPLTFHFVGTHQKSEFANDSFVTGLNSSGTSIAVNIKGNRPVRIPELFYTLGAVYKLPELAIGQIALNADYEYIGSRPGDEANRITLPSYGQVAAGVSLKSGKFVYRVSATNVLNEIGFTEGDPRTALLIGDPNAAYLNARTIGPRAVVASVTMEF